MIPAVLAAAGVGFASALLPVISAEGFQAGASFVQPLPVVMACVVALSLGQTGGKFVIFTATRRGATRWRSVDGESPSQGIRSRFAHRIRSSPTGALVGRLNARLLQGLGHPIGGPGTVAVSAAVGLPPLALVSAAAGVSPIRTLPFTLACFTGRLLRFAVLAGVMAAVTA